MLNVIELSANKKQGIPMRLSLLAKSNSGLLSRNAVNHFRFSMDSVKLKYSYGIFSACNFFSAYSQRIQSGVPNNFISNPPSIKCLQVL